MSDFKIGDWVYASDWCYGQIIDITDDEIVSVEYETCGGGGSMSFDIEEIYHADPPKAKRDVSVVDIGKLVEAIFELLDAYDQGVWEDISYTDLAEVWVEALNSYEYIEDPRDDILKEALRQFISEKCR